MADLFDVFVVGAVDRSPVGISKLAALIANRHGAPAEPVARAITAGSLRAGKALAHAQADLLAQQLNALGALTDLRPASPAPGIATPVAGPSTTAPTMPARTMVGGFGAPNAVGAPGTAGVGVPAAKNGGGLAGPVTRGGGLSLRPLTSVGDPFAPAGTAADTRVPTALGQAPHPFAPPESFTPTPSPFAPPPSSVGPNPTATAGGHDPFAPPPSGVRSNLLGGAPDPFAPPPATAGTSRPAATSHQASHQAPAPARPLDPFGVGDNEEVALELDRGPGPGAARAGRAHGQATSLPGASGLNTTKIVGTSSSSHLQVGEEHTGNLSSVRCPEHGLYYDRKKSSGCRKCLEGARERAGALERQVAGFRLGGYRDNPGKRAFVGLLFALVIGFLPTAFHAFGPGAAEVKRLRIEQEELSQRPGTEEVLKRYDAIDDRVAQSRREALRMTAGIWVLITAGVMAGWYRIT